MGAETHIKTTRHFGLIGKDLAHSFSQDYFAKRFNDLGLTHYSYSNFEFKDESELAHFLLDSVYGLDGLNVTIPYKETIIPYLDKLHESAESVQAVNTVKIEKGLLVGFNTDVYGFHNAFNSHFNATQKKALLLGTGGASKSVAFALSSLGIKVSFVSRNPNEKDILSYNDIDKEMMMSYQILVNCSPLGTFPKTKDCPNIPYEYLNAQHTVLDLIYNPAETLFLKRAKEQGAKVQNGFSMLQHQAEKAWMIWNS